MKFENTKPSVVDHNTVKFRDMKNFDMESLSNDLISCDILNGSLDDDDDILIYVTMKSLRQKERSNPWVTHDIKKLMYERDHVQGYTKQWFKILARLP